MTEKLYDTNPYIREFTAQILSAAEKNGKFYIELDRTCFFPEGGGQPSDKGWIGSARVEYVYEEQGHIYHISETVPSGSCDVSCSIDWTVRLDHMQQHLGQHMLSAALYEMLGVSTVSFHLGRDASTIDLDGFPDAGQLAAAEEYVNRVVYENRPVKICYPSQEELERMKLRKAPQVTENIRIVEIMGFDCSACCGTHPSFTGEVGIIKITRAEKYKGGSRIEFLCGARALRDYVWKSAAMSSMAAGLSIAEADVPGRFEQLGIELQELRKNTKMLEDQLLDFKTAEFLKTAEFVNTANDSGFKLVRSNGENTNPDELRLISRKLGLQQKVAFAAAFNKEGHAEFIFSRSKDLNRLDLRIPCKKALELLEGRGGGSDSAVQGRGTRVDKLEQVLEDAVAWIKETLVDNR